MTAEEREDQRDRRRGRGQTIAGVVAALALGASVVLTWTIITDRNRAVQGQQSLAAQVSLACEGGGPGAAELAAIGACRQAEQVDAPPAPLPSEDQVRRFVREYLEENPPADGRGPTEAEIDAGVQRFCGANRCQGPPGAPAEPAQDGKDGRDGVDAPPVSDEQVLAQVQAYCGDPSEPCRSITPGPMGPMGPPGPLVARYTITRGGVTETCTRVEGSPDTEPAYDCVVMPPPAEDPDGG